MAKLSFWRRMANKASDITSGQFPLARMPRGAAGDVITGAGGGSDPVYATPAAGATFTELAGDDNHRVATADTWEDWNISGIVPAGVIAVLVSIESFNGVGEGEVAGVRTNNTALDRRFRLISKGGMFLLAVPDGSRIIEVYDDCASKTASFGIAGYWS